MSEYISSHTSHSVPHCGTCFWADAFKRDSSCFLVSVHHIEEPKDELEHESGRYHMPSNQHMELMCKPFSHKVWDDNFMAHLLTLWLSECGSKR